MSAMQPSSPLPYLTVIKVEPYSEGDECAAVTLRSDRGEMVVFSFPCAVNVGDQVANRLSAITTEAQAACFSDWPEDLKETLEQERLERIGTYAYRGCGHCEDSGDDLLAVLGFLIDIGGAPCAGPVDFEFERVDL
jgi:hypothetical protein